VQQLRDAAIDELLKAVFIMRFWQDKSWVYLFARQSPVSKDVKTEVEGSMVWRWKPLPDNDW
jgi:hypothetical protein